MLLQLATLNEDEKNLLRAHKQFVKSTIDTIAAYLVLNQDASEAWRQSLQDESQMNYYDALPKGGRLHPQEVEMEMEVPSPYGTKIKKIFKKDAHHAHEAILFILNQKLTDREQKLLKNTQVLLGPDLELITQHLQHTRACIKVCTLLKSSTQLLIAETGTLHYLHKIQEGVAASITNKSTLDYIKLKAFLNEIKELIKRHPIMNYDGSPVDPYTCKDVLKTRQQFNALLGKIKLQCSALNKKELLNPIDDTPAAKYLDVNGNAMQRMFCIKNDVNYAYPVEAPSTTEE